MIATLLAFSMAMHCPKPILINFRPHHEIDEAVLKRGPVKCQILFKDRSPCLKRLERTEGTIDFQATCGPKSR